GVAFVQLRRLENIIRVEMQIASAPAFNTVTKGTGYGFIRYRTTKRDEPLLDPAILSAMQRAFAAAKNDTMMYAKQQGVLNVQPAPVLAIGGLRFVNDPSQPMWGLFANPTVKSYDAALILAEQAAAAKSAFCFDIDTRDSIFALFRLYGIENDGQPSANELDALYKFDVERYIAGEFTRTSGGAHLTLTLYALGGNAAISPIRTAEADIADDNVIAFRSALRKMTRTLLEIE
ncbi:MAG: hypothetical protein JNL32_16335, partial [Candidatus Kapabacteria bacterium]|nr:hypothetical protein [Candidatus Kapabacteria bacterium]